MRGAAETVTLDAAGRLVVPKRLREAAGVRPGQPLRISVDDRGRLEIEPLETGPRLERRGEWLVAVAPAGTPPLTAEAVERVRAELRERSLGT